MELVWATEDLVIAGRPYTDFPILLWDTMESGVPSLPSARGHRVNEVLAKYWPCSVRLLQLPPGA